MGKYVAKRAATGLVAVILSLCINFVLIRLAPGDPINIMAGHENPNPEMVAHLIEKYGLDKPVLVQFGVYLGNLIKGDLGFSYRNSQPVVKLIGERLVPTFMLTLTAIILAFIIGSAIGLWGARRRGSLLEKTFNSTSYLFDAMPSFWLALMLILLFSSLLGWFPTAGMINLRAKYTGFAYVLDVLHHLVLPVTCLVLIQMPAYFRITRSSVTQVMSEDYITLFRGTGMSEKRIFRSYVLKNGILPTITFFGMNVAYCFAGSTFVEMVFAWPGIGRLLMDSIMKRDYPVLSGIYLVISISIALFTILLDLLYAYLDPRIRLK